MSDIKATASLDASGVVKGAKQAQDAIGKFGFSMDGVLTKLARQLSATDIAAAAVFAGIAKGQQVINSSQAAWLAHEKAARQAGQAYSVMLTQIELMDAKIKEHDTSIGSATAAWMLLSKTVEERFGSALNNVVDMLAMIDRSPFIKALLSATGSVGALMSGASTFIGGASNAAAGAGMRSPAPSGGGASGAGGYDSNNPAPPYTSGYADWRRNYGDGPSSRFGGLRGNLLGPGYGALGPPMLGYQQGATSDFSSDMMDELQKQREKYEASLQAEADMIERVNAQLDQFSYAIGSSLVNALFQGQNAVEALKNTLLDAAQQILSQIASAGVKSILGSFIPGLGALSAGGGRTVGTSPSPQALEFYRGVVAPAMAYENRRGR